jgi:hypothetical protein
LTDTTKPGPAADPRLVYNKTAAGLAELSERQLGLSPAARRILILTDGVKSIGELPKFIRPGDLAKVVNELEQRGLLALIGIADIKTDSGSPDMDLLMRFKPKLAGVFSNELKDRGLVLDARVQDAVSMDVLRSVLREGINRAREHGTPEAARRIANVVRSMLTSSDVSSTIIRS